MDLPSNAKLHEMQENTHGLVPLILAAAPDVPNQTPKPWQPKQVLNASLTPRVHIIVPLLSRRQSSFFLPMNGTMT